MHPELGKMLKYVSKKKNIFKSNLILMPQELIKSFVRKFAIQI